MKARSKLRATAGKGLQPPPRPKGTKRSRKRAKKNRGGTVTWSLAGPVVDKNRAALGNDLQKELGVEDPVGLKDGLQAATSTGETSTNTGVHQEQSQDCGEPAGA